MILALFSLLLSANTLQISPLSYVNEGKILLSDVISNASDYKDKKALSKVELSDQVNPYSYQVFTKKFLVDALKKAQIKKGVKIIIPEKAYVVNQTNHWTKENIENNLKIQFAKNCGDCDVEVKLLQFNKYRDAISWDFEIQPRLRNQRLYIPTNVQVLKKNKLMNRNTKIVAEVFYRKKVPVLRSNKKRGEIIKESDVVLKKILLPGHSNFYSSLEDVVGKQAKRTLSQGQLILFSDIKKEIVVRRGDQVQAFVKSDHIEIALSVIARENGAIGETIRVEIPSSRKKMLAKVKSYSEVEIK